MDSYRDNEKVLVGRDVVNCVTSEEGTVRYYDSQDEEIFPKVPRLEKDMVNNPSHYTQGEYEVKDVIRDWKMPFGLGSAIKYIARCELKGNKRQDLEKAIFFLNDELENMEG